MLLIVLPVRASALVVSTVDRYAGPDRYSTAAAVSARTFEPGVSALFVATGENFPDALAGGPVAAKLAAPVLLTARDSLPQVTIDEIRRLQPERIRVLGGTAAVSNAVLVQLASLARGGATRLAGGDRFATAALLSSLVFAPGVPAVFIATGRGFPDALAGGAAAAAAGGPVLLVEPASVPQATADELSRLKPTAITVLGGPGAVSEAVEAQLRSYAIGGVGRSAGGDRYTTAVAVSRNAFAQSAAVFLATGLSFPDALAGVPAAGKAGAPLLLTLPDCIPQAVAAEIERLGAQRLVILGGDRVVSTDVQNLKVCP